MTNSKLFRLNLNDLFKGLIVAVLTGVLTGILQMLTVVPPSIDLKQIAIISITSAISYILKQLATDETGKILKVGGRPRRKKKPNYMTVQGFNFEGLDFTTETTVYAYSDMMSGENVSVLEVLNMLNSQDVKFIEEIKYNSFDSVYFEIETN